MTDTANKDYIEVRVGLLPGVITDAVALNGGRKVKDALDVVGLNSDGFEIRVNGSVSTLETDLKTNDVVLLLKKITGNH